MAQLYEDHNTQTILTGVIELDETCLYKKKPSRLENM